MVTFIQLELHRVQLHLEVGDDVVDVVDVGVDDVHDEVGHGRRHGVVGLFRVIHPEQELEEVLIDHRTHAVGLVSAGEGGGGGAAATPHHGHVLEEGDAEPGEAHPGDSPQGDGDHRAPRDPHGESEGEVARRGARGVHPKDEGALDLSAVWPVAHQGEDLVELQRRAEDVDEVLGVLAELLVPLGELHVVPAELAPLAFLQIPVLFRVIARPIKAIRVFPQHPGEVLLVQTGFPGEQRLCRRLPA